MVNRVNGQVLQGTQALGKPLGDYSLHQLSQVKDNPSSDAGSLRRREIGKSLSHRPDQTQDYPPLLALPGMGKIGTCHV